MNIRELIEKLEQIEQEHGPEVECLVNVVVDYEVYGLCPVDELRFEDRDGYGPSVALL